MYLRSVHAENDISVLHQLIRDHPLGVFTTAIKSPLYPLLQSSHIPFILDVPDTPSPDGDNSTPLGTLRGHMARQNPQAKALMDALALEHERSGSSGAEELSDEVLVLFTAAEQHYVTPKFYTETKPASGKVVPTWNYAAAQVYGKVRVYCDSRGEETGRYLQGAIEDLTDMCEGGIMGHGKEGCPAWKVSDAPEKYVEILKRNIIGVEIRIERLEGKFKMSQEMGVGDREGVVCGFERLGTDVAKGVSRVVKERGEMKDKARCS